MPSPIPFNKYHALGNDYIDIKISPDFAISMTGGVTRVAAGTIDPEMLTWKKVVS